MGEERREELQKMTPELLSKFLNANGASLISVSQSLGVVAKIQKSRIVRGVDAPGSCVAALVGIVGGGMHGTSCIMADKEAFASYVGAMGGGMIAPDLGDSVALSVIGELANMVNGQTLIKMDVDGVDLTPPQLITGENIRAVPMERANTKTMTIPFVLDGGGVVYLVISAEV
jgi:chemotaxis protein CheX